MPTITGATVHQILRYFFVGALAAAFAVVPPGTAWSDRVAYFLTKAQAQNAAVALTVVAVAMLIGGSLIYGAHRVIVYPWIFQRWIAPMVREQTPSSWFQERRWPYGKASSDERDLEQLGASLPPDERGRFVGWASEIHLCYLATEIALFTLVWPGWKLGSGCSALVWGAVSLILLALVVAWDREQASLLVHRARNPVS